MLRRFWLVIVTDWEALVEPTAALPKLIDEGVARMFARAAAANTNIIATAAAAV